MDTHAVEALELDVVELEAESLEQIAGGDGESRAAVLGYLGGGG